jgi:hypothetical protein
MGISSGMGGESVGFHFDILVVFRVRKLAQFTVQSNKLKEI